MTNDTAPPISSPPAMGPPADAGDDLQAIRTRLSELQQSLAGGFSRQGWDEYLRLRRITRAHAA